MCPHPKMNKPPSIAIAGFHARGPSREVWRASAGGRAGSAGLLMALLLLLFAAPPGLPAGGGSEPAFSLRQPASVSAGMGESFEFQVAGPNVEVAALQISLRIPASSAVHLDGPLTSSFSDLNWDVSSTSFTDLNGDVVHRVLLEAPEGQSLTLSPEGQRLGSVHLSPKLWTPAGTVLEVILEDGPPDPVTGRAGCAIATSDGLSLVADTMADGFLDADLDRPRGGTFEITVTPPRRYESVNYADYDAGSPYKYFQLLPTVDTTGTKLVGSAMAGLGFAVNYADASGLDTIPQRAFLGVFLPPFTMAPYLERGYYPAYAGHLLSSEWRIAGDGLEPSDALGVEVSIGSSDSNFLARAVYQETNFPGTDPKGPPVVPFGDNSPRALRVLAEVPGFAADGGSPGAPDGLFPMAAVLARPAMGTQGTTTWMMSQVTERVQPQEHPWLAFDRFLCVDGGCGVGVLTPPPVSALPGSLPVQYAFTDAGAEIILPSGSPSSGRWSGYFSTTPALDLHVEPAFVDSVACVEVEFLMPDARPEQLPNQIIAAFREGSLDYGAIAEFRPQSPPYEAPGPGGLYTRRLWIDSQNIPNAGIPLTISIGISGDAALTGPQRVIIRRVKFTQYLRSSYF